jgi:tryptophanyl-tRNA synthetase
MNEELTPIRMRAADLAAEPTRVMDALDEGATTASDIAKETMAEVRERMGLT